MKKFVLVSLLLFTSLSFASEVNDLQRDNLTSLACSTFGGLSFQVNGTPSKNNPAVVHYFAAKKLFNVSMVSGSYDSKGGELTISFVDTIGMMTSGTVTNYTIELRGPVTFNEKFIMKGSVVKDKFNLLFPVPRSSPRIPITCELSFQ